MLLQGWAQDALVGQRHYFRQRAHLAPRGGRYRPRFQSGDAANASRTARSRATAAERSAVTAHRMCRSTRRRAYWAQTAARLDWPARRSSRCSRTNAGSAGARSSTASPSPLTAAFRAGTPLADREGPGRDVHRPCPRRQGRRPFLPERGKRPAAEVLRWPPHRRAATATTPPRKRSRHRLAPDQDAATPNKVNPSKNASICHRESTMPGCRRGQVWAHAVPRSCPDSRITRPAPETVDRTARR